MTLNPITIVEQVLGEYRSYLSAVTEGQRRGIMAFMPVTLHQKSLAALQPAIRRLLCLADRAAGVADRGLSSLQDHFVLAGGLR